MKKKFFLLNRKNKLNVIDLLKIDVETFENLVVEGGLNSLDNTRYLLIEISLTNNNNYTISSLMKYLDFGKHNFQLIDIHEYRSIDNKKLGLLDCLLENVNFSKIRKMN